jgi:hypothetical protein
MSNKRVLRIIWGIIAVLICLALLAESLILFSS